MNSIKANQSKSNGLAEMKSPSRKGEGLGIGAGFLPTASAGGRGLFF
jgi:hypothetical protein